MKQIIVSNVQWSSALYLCYHDEVMTTIHLPKLPEGEYLEDYVAAFLQCGGFYTEKSVIESGETQVMELDILAWKPTDQPPQHTLFEVKGGDWGFPDIFKVYGWKTYLEQRGVNVAYLIVPRGERDEKVVEYIREKCSDIGMKLLVNDDISSLEANLKEYSLTPQSTNRLDHGVWRFSFWLERQMQKVVSNNRRSLRDNQGPKEVYAYQEMIRNGLVQARDVRERLASLYKAHFEHQWLPKSVAAELDTGQWNSENPSSGTHWNDALYKCKHHLIQAALFYQHRARLDILKGAVEFTLLLKHDALPPERRVRFLGIEHPADFLPSSFHNAVRKLQLINGFEKTPLLWQSFLWKWGGFFLVDHEAEEKATLAQEVGMTVDAVDAALEIYDVLFPVDGGWFQDIQGTRMLKLFPCQFRGIGAHYRYRRQGASSLREVFGELPHRYLVRNLGTWINSTVSLLQYGTSNR